MSGSRCLIVSVVVLGGLMGAPAPAEEPLDTSHIRVKQAIADTMTPEQLEAYKQRLAKNFAFHPGPRAPRPEDTPGDTCVAATFQCFPFPPDSTVGAADNYDLPPDTTAPTCTASTSCTGAGPAGSLPRGAIYTGTGTGPDRAWRLFAQSNCNLTITATPTTGWDLALIVYDHVCSNLLTDCTCVDDTGIGGQAEQVVLSAVAGTHYFIVVDAYSTGGMPPGPSGPYTLEVNFAPDCICPVELERISID